MTQHPMTRHLMTRHLRTLTRLVGPLLVAAGAIVSTAASAHAFLDRAVPAVGSTVSAKPSELRLSFTQGVVAPLSGVTISTAGGVAIAASKPGADAGNRAVLHVRLNRPLMPGSYVVTWHVVSVDTHPTSGSYRFTVAP